ncbi:HD domain-containing protein [Vibrio ezurae]|uniref:HD domain-containing protein n=1 Tax=Vibrio ezurae NBRC 102218 TaxID=1219080 RepID=U3CPS8_9VIBR|nr:HD domain-containing protein [Vibrio ezurae]GAD80163.1 hypothetical protein VEZ01S_25_00460 [Vibrio ezurae NBRC 102218]
MTQATDFEPIFEHFIKQNSDHDLAHDLTHIKRVVNTAKVLAHQEQADLWIVIPAAYLHDCFSYPKDHPERHLSSLLAADKALQFLLSIEYPAHTYQAIYHAIAAHSFTANITPTTTEAQIVQDADRLDSLGAIGIARCIQVSCNLDSQLYSAHDPFAEERELNDQHYAIDHFFSKLFKLPETMNTVSGRKEANKRVIFMRQYLNQLRQEIGGF